MQFAPPPPPHIILSHETVSTHNVFCYKSSFSKKSTAIFYTLKREKILNTWHGVHTDFITHCKEPIPKIENKYSQERNFAATVPISTFVCLWAIYIFPPSICLFWCRKYVDQSWEFINRSQTHECGNWDWGRAIPRKAVSVWDPWHFGADPGSGSPDPYL